MLRSVINGTVIFKDRCDLRYFLLFQYRMIQKIGAVDIDTIKDEKVWYNYCVKQDILRCHPIEI